MKRNLVEVAQELANDLYNAGAIDSVTKCEYEAACLTPVREIFTEEINRIGMPENFSQPMNEINDRHDKS